MSISDTTRHIPVMCSEVLELLRASQGGVFLDCTFGGGGHTGALLNAHTSNIVFAIDRDPRAVERGRRRFAAEPRLTLQHGRFSDLPRLTDTERFDGILADLGMSTDQLWENRGFSFNDNDDFDMRMDPSHGVTAAEMVNSLDRRGLTQVLRTGGLGREAGVVAAAIISGRPISSPKQLAEVVKGALRAQAHEDTHPATVVFQALRIAVNREFEELEALLRYVPTIAHSGSRFAAICFHSQEDQKVARTLRTWEQGAEFSATWPGTRTSQSLGRLLTRKALEPGTCEITSNPSARSARVRCFEFR